MLFPDAAPHAAAAMLLNDQLNAPAVRTGELQPRIKLPLRASRNILLFFLFFAVAVALQVWSGAYRAEFGGYPDEPAHYVTSLMVREYITGPSPLSPMQFAENYYAHYPKVAFGHWPPLFYVVQALWMLLFSPSRVSVLLELAATTALLAYVVYAEVRRWFRLNGSSWSAGVLAGLLLIAVPVIQICTNEEMAESLLILCCFLSVIYFTRYLDSERWQDSLLFGVFFSLAVLTKGSGWLLVLVPPVALLLTRKLRLLFQRTFWLSAGVVAVLCLPWQLSTLRLAERGWTGGTQPSLHYTIPALRQFALIFIQIIGPFLGFVIAIGLVVKVLAPMFRKPVASGPAGMAAFVFAVWVFHSVVPAGVEDRKMAIAVPALILFLFAGGFWLADQLPLRGRFAHWRYSIVLAATAAFFLVQTFAVPSRTHFGYREAARFITTNPQFRGATILVSSGSIGEGLLISEIAMRQPRPVDTVVRGTKALARVDWEGSHYESLFSKPADILAYLDRNGIDLVVTDTFMSGNEFPHNQLLTQTIQQSGLFQAIGTFQGSPQAAGEVRLYRFAHR